MEELYTSASFLHKQCCIAVNPHRKKVHAFIACDHVHDPCRVVTKKKGTFLHVPSPCIEKRYTLCRQPFNANELLRTHFVDTAYVPRTRRCPSSARKLVVSPPMLLNPSCTSRTASVRHCIWRHLHFSFVGGTTAALALEGERQPCISICGDVISKMV